MSERRLYGLPDAERLSLDIEDAIEECWDSGPPPSEGKPLVLHEWTVHPASDHMPLAQTVMEWVCEWTCENGEIDEYSADEWMNVSSLPDVIVAAQAMLDLLGSKVTYSMADKLVAVWTFPSGTHETPPTVGEGVRQSACDGAG